MHKVIGMTDEQMIDKWGEIAEVKYPTCYEWVEDRPMPSQGGLYDPRIFGKPYVCTCGNQRSPGRCKKCGDLVVKESEWIKKVGYLRLPVPYVNDVHRPFTDKAIKKVFGIGLNSYDLWDKEITLELTEDPNEAQFQDQGRFFKVVVSDDGISNSITDYGLSAIYNICKNYNAIYGSVDDVLKYLHILFPVLPVPQRPMSIFDGEFNYSPATQNYLMLMKVCTWANQLLNGISEKDGKFNAALKANIIDQLAIAYSVGKACNDLTDKYKVIETSRKSAFRYTGTTRLDHSGRANIISAEVSIDTALIPPSLAYEAMKKDIIDELKTRFQGSNVDVYDRYFYPDKEVMDIFHSLVENAVVVINRPPTLHKYNMMAFKMKLWEDFDPKNYTKEGLDEACIGINVIVTSPFNADFDGDQMSFFIFSRSPAKDEILAEMGVANNWFYEKNEKPIFIPKNAMLVGLYAATKLLPRSNMSDVKEFDNFKTLELAYSQKAITYNTLVKYKGVMTSYGIEKISDIIRMDLARVLTAEDNFGVAISSKNVGKLIAYIGSKEEKIKIMNELYEFANKITLHQGTSVIKLSELYNAVPEFPEIQEILDNPKWSDQQKAKILSDKLPQIVINGIKDLMPTLYDEYVKGGAKIKAASIVESFMPRVEYDTKNETVSVVKENFVTGMKESRYVGHAIATRAILDQKAKQVPDSGYLTRQVVDAMKNFLYVDDRPSEDTVGILVRRGDAVGRWTIDNELIGSCSKSEADQLVRVKSCIYSNGADASRFYVRKDELNQNLYKPSDRRAIGFSVATATTESITQAQLGLKHGGNLLTPDTTCLKIDEFSAKIPLKNYKVIERTDESITLGCGAESYTFPIPKNALITAEAEEGLLTPGDVIYYLKGMHYIDYSITKLCLIFGASLGSREFDINKTKIFSTISHSPYRGKIHYDGKNVFIGGNRISFSDNVVWYFPEGADIEVGDRLNSGCFSPATLRGIKLPYDQKFHLYYLQLKEIIPELQLLSIELLFKVIFSVGAANLRSAIKKQDPLTAITHEAAKSNMTRIIETDIFPSITSALLLNAGDNYTVKS